ATLLVIEDEDQVRDLLVQFLKINGYKVFSAPNGKVGMDIFRNHNIDLVVTDIFMPEKEGLETIKEMKREKPSINIIAISGGGQKGNMEFLHVAKFIGADRTLAKPFSIHELLRMIKELLNN
ncbi:MAG: response regulator, partial [Nitrospirae bacterium]